VTRRRQLTSLSDSPVLVGCVTVLVAAVAVFLSYNANSGLPFVPTKRLVFESPNGSALTAGNQVREGGRRVGLVTDLEPVRKENGDTVAKITIKLDGSYEDVPRDSTVAIRPLSLSGLKYVELTRGKSSEEFVEGDTISVDQARVPVQLDDLGNMYNADTREGVRNVVGGAGNAFAARGRSLNESLRDLPRLLRHLEPVARTLGDPDTNLGRLIDRLGRTVRTVAPVADSYANTFSAGADTLEAWSRNEERLRASLREGPPTLAVGIPSLRVQRPFLEHARRTSIALRGAAEVMPSALPRIASALDRGAEVQPQTPRLYAQLKPTLVSLEQLMTDRRTTGALRGITDTVQVLRPITRFLGPHITVCNLFNYAFTNAGEAGMEPALGRAQRSLVNFVGPLAGDRALGTLGAAEPADELHLNVYPAAIDDRGRADCETGQRGYMRRAAASAPPDRNIVIDPETPGNQGPNYVGRSRVPEGQTFSRRPEVRPGFPAGSGR
jgi:virulence factor Mce-like protein